MHTRVPPKGTLLDPAHYDDVVADVRAGLADAVARAEAAGVHPEQLLLDPGPDFAKTPAQTVAVLRRLDVLHDLGRPLLLALSRKPIEFARNLAEQGRSWIDAAMEAARIRMRPILMTSFAFIFGVLPMAIASGVGSGAQNAIGTAVIGGMIAATILVPLLTPFFFVEVNKLFAHNWFKRREATPARPEQAE